MASLGLLACLAAGCATLAPRSQAPGPEATALEHVPLRAFEDDECGAGSLSIVLNALGDAVTPTELAATLPRTRGGGVLSVDLLLAARQRGFSAALVTGNEAVLRQEIQESRPAILMLRLLNAPGRGADIYHYVVVDGHDAQRELFRMQFGDAKARWAGLRQIEGAWKGAGHALITVAAPPALAELRAAVGLERAGRLDEAAEQYARCLERHPDWLRAWVNLGNVEAARGRPQEAERAFRRALAISAADADALNNLAWLLLEEGVRLEEAESLARTAAARPGPDHALVLDTLARIQAARGRCAEAEATYARALAQPTLPADRRARLEQERLETGRSCRPLPQ